MNIHKDVKIKNRKGNKCIYCSEKSTDGDHVVCRNLFPEKGKGLSLIKVPSCRSCNFGLSKDEEFFRLFIAGASLDWSEKASIVFNTSVKRQIREKPILGVKQFNKMKLIDLKTNSGIYTGEKATAQYVSKEDWERCHRVIAKTIKGLLYTIHGYVIADDNFEMVTTLGWDDTIKQFLPFLEYFEPSEYRGIFIFAYAMTSDAAPVSVWFTSYYDRITFCTFVRKKGSFPKMKLSSKNFVLDLLEKDKTGLIKHDKKS